MLLHYASRARVDWHDKLALHKAYNIATINEDLLTKIACELDSREVHTNLEQVHTDSCEWFIQTNHILLPSHNSPAFTNHDMLLLLLLPLLIRSRHIDATTAASHPRPACDGLALHLSRWNKHVQIVFNQQNMGDNSRKMHAVGNLHGLPRLTLQAPQGAHDQYARGHSPERGHHGAVGATTTNSVVPFTTTKLHQPAQSASGPMKPTQIVPPAMCRPCGTTQRPHTAHVISKDIWSIRAGESSAGISNGLRLLWSRAQPRVLRLQRCQPQSSRLPPPSTCCHHVSKVGP